MENLNEIEKDLNNISERVESIRKDIDLIISGIENRPKYKPEPEFKVGQWAKWKDVDDIYYLLYIIKFDEDKVIGISDPEEGENWQCNKKHLVSVTPAEIESHLRKICDEKYIGKKVKCLAVGKYKVSAFNLYEFDGDYLWYQSCGSDNIMIYHAGKFAEIIPDKKLPKTKEQFPYFLSEFCRVKGFSSVGIDDFLNQYETI